MCGQESREAAQQRKEEQRALVREHRKREKELGQQGKKPFYIKKCKPCSCYWMVGLTFAMDPFPVGVKSEH